VTSANAWNATLYANLNFDFISDIASRQQPPRYGVLVVHPSFPANSVPEFIAYTKANPGKINMGSGGVGSGSHLWGELFKMMAGVDMLHVPYRGGGPAVADLLTHQVQIMFDTLATSIGHIRNGALRALAVTAATRLVVLPDVPTLAEFVPGYEAAGWGGFGAPRNTSAEILDKLNKEINAGLADPVFKALIADLGSEPMPMTPTEFARFIAAETDKWAEVIKFASGRLFGWPIGRACLIYRLWPEEEVDQGDQSALIPAGGMRCVCVAHCGPQECRCFHPRRMS